MGISYKHLGCLCCIINSTSDYWTLYRSYVKGISANIELQLYNVTRC
jgi:hypothetical protein